jgi:uncharacterized protein
MNKFTRVLGSQFLALCLFALCLSSSSELQAQNSSVSSNRTGVAYEKSSARDSDLAKIPVLTARVTDLTGTLTPSQIASIEQKLSAFETLKGSQLAVLIVPTTQPEAIDQYSLRVVEKWKLGRSKVDDGILLLIAKDDHRLRFEVGYGLEGAMNDLTSKRIIVETIAPFFKQGQYFEGINAGLDRVIKVVSGEELPLPPQQNMQSQDYGDSSIEGILLMAFMFSLFFGSVLKKILGKGLGGLVTGGVVGFIAFTMTGLIGIALLAGVVGLFSSMMGGLGGRGGPIIFPGGGGFGGGGGGFGGGGFGGGGGGFGGGGASGDW